MADSRLRAVDPVERSHRKMTVLDATEHGTRADELRAIRVVIAKALDDPGTSPRDLAALSRRQIEISAQLESLAALEARSSTSTTRRSFRGMSAL